MSTKATSLSAATVAVTATSASSTGPNDPVLGGVVKIKKELPNDEIKEFAENTMNELLGWYGFDGVDRLDLSTKTSRLLSSAATAAANNKNINNNNQHSNNREGCISSHAMEKRRSRSRAASLLQQEQIFRNNNNNNINNKNNNINMKNSCGKNVTNCHSSNSTVVSATIGGNESTTSDHDTRSSRDDDSKSPISTGKNRLEEKIDLNNCCWCRRPVAENAPEYLTTTDGPRYCSESCFTQSRRASFKKAKTCDWCKHVRHAVSYVDFQDGASQLQFCSDKCLNQYKMQIFCKETQAHLDMNPHLRDQGLEAASNGANLITPDLWLRNCRSRSVSPASTISVSPGPTEISIMPPVLPPLSPSARATPSLSGNQSISGAISLTKTTHKPIISVAPASKLMSKATHLMNSRPAIKNTRRKRPIRACAMVNNTTMQNSTNPKQTTLGRDILMGGKSNHNSHVINNTKNMLYNHGNVQASTSSGLSQFAGSSVQDLHMTMPPLSPMSDQQSNSMGHVVNHQHPRPTNTCIPPTYFATPTHHSVHPPTSTNHQPPLTGYSPNARAPFLPSPTVPGMGHFPRLLGLPAGFQAQHPLPTSMTMVNQFPQPDMASLNALIGAPPPVTVMVPYPIIIPLPIPIPVPLPITDFYKAYRLDSRSNGSSNEPEVLTHIKKETAKSPNIEVTQTEEQKNQDKITSVDDEPLDYTTAKDSPIEHTSSLIIERAEEVEMQSNKSEERKLTPQLAITPEPSTPHSPIKDDNDQIMHCIVEADENAMEDESNANTNSDNAAHQKLPKFKITRLQTKRTLIQAKETAENSRPLRKRKRIIDCDFQKVALKDVELKELEESNNNERPIPVETGTEITTDDESTNFSGTVVV